MNVRKTIFACLFAVSASLFAQPSTELLSSDALRYNAFSSSTTDLKKSYGSLSSVKEGSDDILKIPNAQLAMSVPNYRVTAGDVYTLAFAANTTPVTYAISVDSSYKIRIANMGVLNCAGLTYPELKAQVESLVLRNYPMGGVQFVLTAPARFVVSVTGEVETSAEGSAWALTRLSVFLEQRFTQYASERNIMIESLDGTKTTYDLFAARRDGDYSQDPFLRPGDRIVVNRIERKVEVSGAVERPGAYELLPGENLKDLIERYGNGLAPLADTSRIELLRMKSGEVGSGVKSYLTQSNIDANEELFNYDSIYIASYKELEPVVFVEGAVTATATATATALDASTRITAPFNNGEDYAYFVRRNKAWFSAESDLENAYVIRKTQVIALNINQILYDLSYDANLVIEANDTLVIPFKQFFVSVAGPVTKPGRYPYIPNRTWDYYVGLAGGFDKTKNAHEAVFIVDLNGKKLSKTDAITPETTITAKTNSKLYYFNQYAPVITIILTAISTSLSIMAVTGVL